MIGVRSVFLILLITMILIISHHRANQAKNLAFQLKQENHICSAYLNRITYLFIQDNPELSDHQDKVRILLAEVMIFHTPVSDPSDLELKYPNLKRDLSTVADYTRQDFKDTFYQYSEHVKDYNYIVKDPLWGSDGLFGSLFMGRRDPIILTIP
jgi:hypothetical protein